MAVKMRLRRMGKRNRPFYRICVIEGGRARDAEYIESLGHYNPYVEDDHRKVSLNTERAAYWLSVGAQPSETVRSFLRNAKVTGLAQPKKSRRRRKRRPADAAKKPSAKE